MNSGFVQQNNKILLKVALNTINLTYHFFYCLFTVVLQNLQEIDVRTLYVVIIVRMEDVV